MGGRGSRGGKVRWDERGHHAGGSGNSSVVYLFIVFLSL